MALVRPLTCLGQSDRGGRAGAGPSSKSFDDDGMALPRRPEPPDDEWPTWKLAPRTLHAGDPLDSALRDALPWLHHSTVGVPSCRPHHMARPALLATMDRHRRWMHDGLGLCRSATLGRRRLVLCR